MRLDEITKTLNPPSISVGDEVKVGKWKNRKAVVKGFTKDDHGQPVLKTTKGDQKLYKPRVSKLEPKEVNEIQEQSMTNNELVQQAIAKFPNSELISEIEYQLEIQAESEEPIKDYYLALQDIEEFAEYNRAVPLLRAARRVLIELGVYRAVSDEQLARIQNLGGKKYYFKLAGVKYNFDKHLGTR